MNKRSFIKHAALSGIGATMGMDALAAIFKTKNSISPAALAADDAFWKSIRDHYILKTDYINLENGYYNMTPQPTLEKYFENIRYVNYHGAFYMRTMQVENKQKMATKLANLVGCGVDELIITRNTTESLDTIISGQHWEKGDEAVMALQDYGAMLDMFQQVSDRHGVVLKKVSVPNHPSSDEELVALYENAITPKTKLLMICHMINISGQIMPVKKICDMAHSKGVDVMVDGAHAIAQLEFNIRDLNCDYYGASLHKWLGVPLGVGMLYVRKEKIHKVWPLIADNEKDLHNIKRLNHTGTVPSATDLTIADAIDYYMMIGVKRKEERLRYLQQYWTSKVRGVPKIVLNTPADPQRACAIANVGIEGIPPATLAKRLLEEHKIYTVAIDNANVQGCRITPNLFTTTSELDALVRALKKLAA
jgi:selenocysteine lyase/cysteine desulfurase